jgi:DNA-binding CsgD family transcriptional regulator/PAS domain-containing protein
MRETDLAQTLDGIYEAAVDYGRWPGALQRLGDNFDCTVVSLIERNMRNWQSRGAASGIDLEGQREYFAVWDARNIFVQRTKSWRAGAIEIDRQIMPQADILASDYYNGFLKPRDMHNLLRLALHVEGETLQSISLMRAPCSGEFGESEIEHCRLFMPHLQRAARITHHFDRIRLRLDAMAEAMEQHRTGVMLVDRAGRVVFANRAARVLAQAGDGLSLRGERLQLSDSRDDGTLQRLLAGATRQPERLGASLADTPRGGVMRLVRPSGKADLVAVVASLAPERAWNAWGRDAPMAMVAISDPVAAGQPPEAMLRELFGLSAAEIRVALALLEGGSPAQIADRLGIKLTTARWHLAALFRKTGTARQAELVRLLLSLPTTLGRLPN